MVSLLDFYMPFIPVPFAVEYLLPESATVEMLKSSLVDVGVSAAAADVYTKSYMDLNRVSVRLKSYKFFNVVNNSYVDVNSFSTST